MASSPYNIEADPPDRDHLTSLPSEIIQTISSYLYAAHCPNRDIHELNAKYNDTPSKLPVPRDLANLARTSKLLHQQTNAWAHHFLHFYRAITKHKIYKTPKAAAKQNPLQKLLQWSAKNCVFCGKPSARTAILMNGLHCCRGCDRAQWPDKITETEARKQHKFFKFRNLVLLHGQRQVPNVTLRYGTYYCSGVLTTMYLREDVEAYMHVMREFLDPGDPGERKKERKRERLQLRVARTIVIDDDDDDEEDGDGDGEGAVEGGSKSGPVFQEQSTTINRRYETSSRRTEASFVLIDDGDGEGAVEDGAKSGTVFQ